MVNLALSFVLLKFIMCVKCLVSSYMKIILRPSISTAQEHIVCQKFIIENKKDNIYLYLKNFIYQKKKPYCIFPFYNYTSIVLYKNIELDALTY